MSMGQRQRNVNKCHCSKSDDGRQGFGERNGGTLDLCIGSPYRTTHRQTHQKLDTNTPLTHTRDGLNAAQYSYRIRTYIKKGWQKCNQIKDSLLFFSLSSPDVLKEDYSTLFEPRMHSLEESG